MSTNDIAIEKTVDAERPAKGLHVTLWVLQALLAAFMIAASGAPKLFGVESAAEGFALIGWGDWFMYAVGALEVAGGVGLLIPRACGLAAIGLSLLMVGAAIFNATILDYPVYTPLILLVLFALIAWARFYQTRRFLSRGFKAV
ncbi:MULTISPECIES: DoxX family protein [Glycomyces]|uniref:DoxX-like protein n=1 Tax=Glycomyces artemisiae TaxID=1076443 RepID=A0A2T0UEY5_9ACTN|nr:DoxX family protein [Glycomyces artemisiae]PRY56506.1 DoxX-like protein [Glycomyces artemisiae]